jgi:hypothetical protein
MNMADLDQIRTFAEKLRDEGEGETRIVGTTGAHVALTKAEVAKELLAVLDSLPAPTSSERIPPAVRRSIDDYVTKGLRPGHCVMAILCDELSEAFHRADPETRDAMPAIVAYVRNETPAGCWGCMALVEQWIARARS